LTAPRRRAPCFAVYVARHCLAAPVCNRAVSGGGPVAISAKRLTLPRTAV